MTKTEQAARDILEAQLNILRQQGLTKKQAEKAFALALKRLF